MRVECSVEEVELDGDNGQPVESVRISCNRCGKVTESYGTTDRSVKRCLVLLRDDCPQNESNFYVEE